MKRSISLLLCAALLIACMVTPTFAAGIESTKKQAVYAGNTFKGNLTCGIFRYSAPEHGCEEMFVRSYWDGSTSGTSLFVAVEVVDAVTGAIVRAKLTNLESNTDYTSVEAYPAYVEGRRYVTYGCSEIYGSNFSGTVFHSVTG